jgi:phosphotransacetylase
LLVDREDPAHGPNGRLFLADCGVIPEPNVEQLADIAVATADFAWHLTNETPRVAFLAYSTQARKITHPSIELIRQAMELAREKAEQRGLPAHMAGEMQLDAALNPEVAASKGLGDDPVAGRANVLIFPNLHAANIAAKMIQVVAGAHTYGQLITGLAKPCAEISRGALVYDIWGTAVVTAARAVDPSLLYGTRFPPATR